MSEENRTPTLQFVELGDIHQSRESNSDGEENLRSQFLERSVIFSEVEKKINGIVASLFTDLEALVQSMRELNEKISIGSTEKNVASEQSRWSTLQPHTFFRSINDL